MAKLTNLQSLFVGRAGSQADQDVANNFSTVGRETFRKVIAALSKKSRFLRPLPGMLQAYFSPQAAPVVRSGGGKGPSEPRPH
ncbi:MAG: hypothetical protein AB7E85_06135 [Pseudobdellovibrionaceae bacterium]